MTSRWFWRLHRLSRRIWVRATLFSLGAVVTALVAVVASPYIPADLPTTIGSDAVDNILGIIAASMLTVTTFSLSTMVSAYAAATANVTPRATTLVMEDSTAQNVLATFVGSFLFSLVGIIALSAGLYGDRGRVVLFAVTLLVVVAIVATLLRWIDHLSRLGRVTETTQRVEAATAAALAARRDAPTLGAAPLTGVPPGARPVAPAAIGYVQHLDVAALAAVARAGAGRIFVAAIPGDFVDPTAPLAHVESPHILDESMAARIRACFVVEDIRTFDQDPRFGASVLAEIACRALSPATNDPGTAIDVIGRALRLLALWGEPPATPPAVAHPEVFVPKLAPEDLFDDLFMPIARDGAGTVEVGMRLQKALATLARLGAPGYADNARRHAALALARAEAALDFEDDRVRLRRLAAEVAASPA